MDGLLATSVVIPPDSEIVAKFLVSGTRPHGCILVEPARQLIEEYGGYYVTCLDLLFSKRSRTDLYLEGG